MVDSKYRLSEKSMIILKTMRANEGVLIRPSGSEIPFRVMNRKTGKFADIERQSFLVVNRLVSAGWVEGGRGKLVESYSLTRAGCEILEISKVGRGKSSQGTQPYSSTRRLVQGLPTRAGQTGIKFDKATTRAWQRFQEDFELACLSDPRFSDWDSAFESNKPETWGPFNGPTDDGTHAARLRSAVAYLGADMATVMLRFFCLKEGIEDMEKRLNWPARSGKVVLAIAARHLVRFYG